MVGWQTGFSSKTQDVLNLVIGNWGGPRGLYDNGALILDGLSCAMWVGPEGITCRGGGEEDGTSVSGRGSALVKVGAGTWRD